MNNHILTGKEFILLALRTWI